MIPHLRPRLPERCTLPFIRRCRLGKAINESQNVTDKNFFVKPERLLA